MDTIQQNREAFFDKLLSGELNLDKWLDRASDKAKQQLIEYNRRKEKERKEREARDFFRSGGIFVDKIKQQTEWHIDGNMNITEHEKNEIKLLTDD